MTFRKRLDRDTFIRKGTEQNEFERKRFGIPAAIQIDPEQAWEAMYGKRKYVYLELDGSLVPFGGKTVIVDDEAGNGFYGDLQ